MATVRATVAADDRRGFLAPTVAKVAGASRRRRGRSSRHRFCRCVEDRHMTVGQTQERTTRRAVALDWLRETVGGIVRPQKIVL